ncbi:MAG TPA: MEDS domain-containing protein, partial [Pyrinomonadaceae bacterium]|nr:MEDS domain-containing protein [Pyrinomonadaceae bacterium]
MSRAINNPDPLADAVLQNAGGISVDELAPRSDWSGMGELDHSVQFYEADTSLLDSLAGFIGTGLERGDAAIVVATEAHREALDERLEARGLDVASAKAAGQYVSLDASETLAKFMVDGSPDSAIFRDVIGGLVERAAAGRPAVRIFGEMVALLWAEGKCEEATNLEGLWNELHKTHRFSLLCGYPMNGFCGESMAEPLHSVCAQHSSVVPAESYTSLNGADERLRAIILLQQKARLLEAEIAERKDAEVSLR